MANPKLNIEEIVRSFPGRILGTHGKPRYNLESPFDVALRENQLRMVQAELDIGPAIPAHYFVYAQGEPATREQSRIGGLPYRPRELVWPRDSNGRPKEFVCQVDFSDSRSLLPSLPGDIMLLFASEEGLDSTPFKVEWYPSGLTDLINVRDLPELNFTFPMVRESVHCYLYETHDFPEAKTRLKGTQYETWICLGHPCGSKIAGYHEEATSTHIFTLESVRLLEGQPYPFAIRKEWGEGWAGDRIAKAVRSVRGLLRKPARPRCYDIFMIGDLGHISVLKEANDQFRVSDESH